jgi:hypothetical protein
MIIISHRGNINGPDKNLENVPEHILNAISQGFDVEVDTWFINNKIYFGHNGPEYLVNLPFLFSISKNAWFHCKNIDALYFFTNDFPNFKFFWHQNDDYALTSNNIIWTYPGKVVTNRSIIVNLELKNIQKQVYGICTDYPILLKEKKNV